VPIIGHSYTGTKYYNTVICYAVVWQHVMGMVSVVLDVLGATVWGVNCWMCWVRLYGV